MTKLYEQRFKEFKKTLKPLDKKGSGYLDDKNNVILNDELEGAFQDWLLANPLCLIYSPDEN